MPPETDRTDETSPPPATAGRKRRRWLWILLGAGLLAIPATVFLAPLAISAFARSALLRAGAERGFTVSVASVSFDWFDGLSFAGITAREDIPHGIRVEVESVEAAPRWRSLLGGRLALGRFRIQRPLVVFDPERRPPERPVASGAAPPEAAESG
ncbi:MAG: hypothetical protein JXQ29_18945, partial [Planctomycetes bacterium]|nr:hypothetical protein [Planctomycetota bacterium]